MLFVVFLHNTDVVVFILSYLPAVFTVFLILTDQTGPQKLSICCQRLCFLCVSRADAASCEFVIGWETLYACEEKQREVEMVNGTIKIPDTGAVLSLGALYFR